jgi:Bacterial pre-peptidase C-terminal domain
MKCLSSRLMAAALALSAAWLAGGGLPRIALAQPSLSHVVPGAVAPGKTTALTLHGTKLNGPLRAWTSFPAQVEVQAGDPQEKDLKQATFKITVGTGIPLGIGGLVVATADGASDVCYVMLDDLPSTAESGDNHTPGTPQNISLPAAIDGVCDGTLFDYYRFAAKAGQRISCEVVAARLGWDFDPLVRVLDSAGRELLISDDNASSGADTRFVFTALADGQYLLELRDNRYKPGGRYRLRLGDFPLVSTPVPLVAQRGVLTTLSFAGPLVEGLAPLTILPLPGAKTSDPVNLTLRATGGQAAAWTTVEITDLPVFAKPVGGQANVAAPIRLPCIAAGCLNSPRERDLFEFQAVKGTPLAFRATTRSAGSAAIVSLRLLDSAGKQLAESPVTDSDEPMLSFNPPADGAYQLAVEELVGRGGGDFTYAVECRAGPQFTLSLKNDKLNRLRYATAGGGAFTLDVQCQRTSYDGPIRLSIDAPRAGWQVFNNVIPAKAAEVKVYVVPPPDLAASDLAELRITGRAEVGGKEIIGAMATTSQLRTARPQMPYPPAWHDGALFVAGAGNKPSFFSVSPAASDVSLSRMAGEAKLTLDFQRLDEKFKDTPLVVLPLGLPAGVTAEVKRNGSGPKETYDVLLKGSKDLADGQHVFRYFAYAELAGRGQAVQSGDIKLNVTP